jgi:hypothetical protein
VTRTLAALAPVAVLALLACNQDYDIAEGTGAVVVSPALVDAGAIAVGDEQSVLLTVSHASGGKVGILAVEMAAVEGNAFVVEGDPFVTLSRGERADLSFRFSPDRAGYFLSKVSIVTNAQRDGEHLVTLRGQGVSVAAELLPGVVDFGPVATGTVGETEVELLNTGASALSLDALGFSDARFSSSLELPAEVAVGGSLAIPLAYAATDEAETGATLQVTLSPSASLAPVTLRANACSLGGGSLYDRDADGYSACGVDCDDGDATVHPGAPESCDGIDQDCDGQLDEGTSCADDDGDGASEDDGDCNDADPARSPLLTEVYGNGIDDDCDGVADDGALDDDGDGYDATAGDCDDTDPASYPGAPELADGADNDCDGSTDEGTSAYDDDGDGLSEDAGDCDDTTASRGPGAVESANGIDDDCDGSVDEGTDWADDDGDGASERGGDCDDTDASAYPGAVEVTGDGIDNDCDGTAE